MLQEAVLIVCLFWGTSSEVVRTNDAKNVIIPFYKLYTPYDILGNAEFTTEYSQYTSTALKFDGDTTPGKRIFKLPLIPNGILYSYSDITVVVTVGLDNEKRDNAQKYYDSDPKFLLSDGRTGIGFDVRDELDNRAICNGMQATMGETLSSVASFSGSPHQYSILPEEIVLTLKPSQRWGSCFIAANSGVISPVKYTRSIHPDQGLWLEVYREDSGERYTFIYIKIEIHEN
ncbi:uncharacterized protein [Dysidea avara]|uniref:uncharacterized protein n=1 Tax=Dysidea avara TaxID=196820 RepID=UPI00331D4AB7